jgi:hypothetical protein
LYPTYSGQALRDLLGLLVVRGIFLFNEDRVLQTPLSQALGDAALVAELQLLEKQWDDCFDVNKYL